MDFFASLFNIDSFMPHGHCYLWRPEILWVHVLSDALVAASYYSIPLALLVFISKRRDLQFRGVFVLFILFICACGTTHVMDIWTTWQPLYGLQGLIKLITATVSVATAIVLWPLIPKALALRSPLQLEGMNIELEGRVRQRTEALESRSRELVNLNDELQAFNRVAMAREERIIELKQEVNRLAQAQGQVPPYDLSGLAPVQAC